MSVFSTVWRVGFICVASWIFSTQDASAGKLEGEVKGAHGQPRAYLRVEITGGESRTLFTNAEGRFTIDLKDGNYAVTIQERAKRKSFPVQVTNSPTPVITFQLSW